jgi:hypothetical protein
VSVSPRYMRNRPSTRLTLAKSTLRALGGRDLRRAAGGGGTGDDLLIATDSCERAAASYVLSCDCLRVR